MAGVNERACGRRQKRGGWVVEDELLTEAVRNAVHDALGDASVMDAVVLREVMQAREAAQELDRLLAKVQDYFTRG